MRIDANGLKVHCQLAGPASAPAVVLVHALGSSGAAWETQVPALTDRYRVLRFDLRGHGGTPVGAGPCRLDGLAADALALLDVLEIPQAHWVGLSLGAMVVQSVVLARPGCVRSMVLAGARCDLEPDVRALWEERIALVERAGVGAVCEPTMETWFTARFLEANSPGVRAVRAQFLATPTLGYVAGARAVLGLDYRNRLPGIPTRARVLVGAEDVATPPATAEALSRQLPGADLVVVEGAAHLANVERPDAFNAALRAFLDAE